MVIDNWIIVDEWKIMGKPLENGDVITLNVDLTMSNGDFNVKQIITVLIDDMM